MRAATTRRLPGALQPVPDHEQVPGWARQLINEVRQLRETIERQSSRLSRADIGRLRAILPAVAGVLGSDPVTSNDLTSHESPAIRLVVAGLSSKSVGRLFSRAESRPVDRFVLRFERMQDNVKQWSIHRTIDEVSGVSRGF